MPMRIETNGANSKVAIDGEITIYVVQEFKDALQETLKHAKDIEIDLSQVTEIDGAGLQLLIAAKTLTIARGSHLRLVAHSMPVLEALALGDLAGFFGDPIVMQAEAVGC